MAVFGTKNTKKGMRPIERFIELEQKLHKRLNHIESETRRIQQTEGTWLRHIPVSEADIQPVGPKTALMHVVFPPSKKASRVPWIFGGIAGGVILAVILIAMISR